MTNIFEGLDQTFGPSYKYAEYKRGDAIAWLVGTQEHTGIILRACAPQDGDPVIYMVEDERGGFPTRVESSQIVPRDLPQEPIL